MIEKSHQPYCTTHSLLHSFFFVFLISSHKMIQYLFLRPVLSCPFFIVLIFIRLVILWYMVVSCLCLHHWFLFPKMLVIIWSMLVSYLCLCHSSLLHTRSSSEILSNDVKGIWCEYGGQGTFGGSSLFLQNWVIPKGEKKTGDAPLLVMKLNWQ